MGCPAGTDRFAISIRHLTQATSHASHAFHKGYSRWAATIYTWRFNGVKTSKRSISRVVSPQLLPIYFRPLKKVYFTPSYNDQRRKPHLVPLEGTGRSSVSLFFAPRVTCHDVSDHETYRVARNERIEHDFGSGDHGISMRHRKSARDETLQSMYPKRYSHLYATRVRICDLHGVIYNYKVAQSHQF